jgi:hypothetical protein
MSREDDRLIASWLGHKIVEHCPCGEGCDSIETQHGIEYLPDYSTSDSDAIALLPVLVEKYSVRLEDDLEWSFTIWADTADKWIVKAFNKPTIAAAITSAVLQLIEKER